MRTQRDLPQNGHARARGEKLAPPRLLYGVTFEHGAAAVQGMLRQPAMRAIWKGSRASYGARMAAMVDKLAENLALATPVDLADKLKADLSAIHRE